MGRYVVVMKSVPSALALAGSLTLVVDKEKEVRIEDISIQTPEGFPQHLGLAFTVSLEANCIAEALASADDALKFVVDLLCFAHGAALADAVPSFVMSNNPGEKEREFQQWFYNIPVRSPRRHFRLENLKKLATAISNVSIDSLRNELQRALHYARKSDSESDPIDSFEDAWNGLESLNKALVNKHGLSKSTESKACPSCGKPLRPSNAGIQHAVTSFCKDLTPDWDKLKGIRNRIVHGGKRILDLLPLVHDHIQVLRRALGLAILDLLDVPNSEWNAIQRQSFRIQLPTLMVRAKISWSGQDTLKSWVQLPRFDYRITITASEGSAGDRTFQSQSADIQLIWINFKEAPEIETQIVSFPDPLEKDFVRVQLSSPPSL